MGITPDPELDAYMRAEIRTGKRESIVTDLIIKMLGLDVSLCLLSPEYFGYVQRQDLLCMYLASCLCVPPHVDCDTHVAMHASLCTRALPTVTACYVCHCIACQHTDLIAAAQSACLRLGHLTTSKLCDMWKAGYVMFITCVICAGVLRDADRQ